MTTPNENLETPAPANGSDPQPSQDFHSLLAGNLHPKLILTAELRVIAANEAFYTKFNLEPHQIDGRPFFEICDGNWQIPPLRELLGGVFKSKAQQEIIQLDYDPAEGQRKTLRCEASLSSPNGDDSEVILLSFEDCTQHRRLEDALRESEVRTHTILKTAVDAIVMIDERGRIKSFNPPAEQLFGYAQDEVLGENVRLLMPPPYCDEHDTYIQNYLSTGNKKVIGIGREVVGRRKDGTSFPMELSITELQWSNRRFFLGTVRDITKQKRTEEALRNSEASTRAILDTAVDAVVTIDGKGIVKSFNMAAQKMFGYSAEEAVGENVTMLMPSPYSEEHDGYLKNYLQTGRRRIIGIGREVVGLKSDGTTFPMELSVSEVAHGDRRSYTGIVRDISERKRAETRLRENVADLEQAHAWLEEQRQQLEAQAESLLQTQERAENANQAKSSFLAKMSHEIRTPLTAVLGFADVLMSNLENEADIEAARIIQSNGKHLLGLINDILDLSKIEAGKVERELSDCSPVRIMDDVVSLLSDRARQNGLYLEVEYGSPVPAKIHTDAMRLRQTLLNLIGNAVKFTKQGGVRVLVDMPDRYGAQPKLRFQIIDTGIGIRKEQIPLLFEAFEQAHPALAEFSGTGLGLSISKRLAELLGGTITVESTFGQGSRFTLTIDPGPIGDARFIDGSTGDSHQQEQPSKSKLPKIELSCRILVAEDSRDNQRLLKHMLSRSGAEAELVENGALAVEAVAAASDAGRPFDIVLMDMNMPEMDGYEATRRLRQRGHKMPIIALTAHAMSGAREQCLEAGCDAYCAKPIDWNELLQLVAKHTVQQQEALV